MKRKSISLLSYFRNPLFVQRLSTSTRSFTLYRGFSSAGDDSMRAVRVHKVGGPECLQLDEKVEVPAVKDNEVLVDVAYSGVNYIDTYHRSGLYPLPLPTIIGREGSGRVSSVGKGVKDFKVGAPVAFCLVQGTYAEKTVVAEDKAIPVPEGMTLADAAAAPLQGLTAHYLVTSSYPIKKGDTILVHAGAGGTGGLIIQMGKILGATVITTVSNAEKAEIAKAHGADHVINYSTSDFVQEVKKITDGKGCHAVYDGVGKSTYEKSMLCLRRRGFLVLFGNASGPVPPIDPLTLTKHGSITITRPSLIDFISDQDEFKSRCKDLYGWIAAGKLKVSIAKIFPMDKSDESHRYLEARKALGKILIAVNSKL